MVNDAITTEDTFEPLLSIGPFETPDGFIEVDASFAGAAAGALGFFRLRIDGVLVPSSGVGFTQSVPAVPANTVEGGAILRRIPVDAGMHTVELVWRVDTEGVGNTLRVQPATLPDAHHASLIVRIQPA